MMTPVEQPIYRFSEAPIWEWQRAYYEEQGIKAWQNDEVPQYITSNPFIAAAYAEIIFGFLQDRARLGYISEPVTVVELGAGSGRLAFHVLVELCELRDLAGFALPPFRYVMSDLALDNIAYWQEHHRLILFVEQGVLDFAKFDATVDTELVLTQSGEHIRAGGLEQPLLVVANYFFDSIPQELIYVEDNKILECQVSLEFPEGTVDLNASATDLLENVALEYHYRRAEEYEREAYEYRHVIEQYREKLEDSHILFPAMGMACLERLGQLSQQGFLLITADKGDHRLEQWEYAEPPKLIVHGSFSLTVNYHAIQSYWESKGAISYFAEHHHHNLNVGCILMLQDPKSYGNTRLAYRRVIERYGPDELATMKPWLDGQLEHMELHQILTIWRLGGYDVEWLVHSSQRISSLLLESNESVMQDIRSGLHLMWNNYYAMGEKLDLALVCGMLLYQMEFYEDALVFLERSVRQNEVDCEATGGGGTQTSTEAGNQTGAEHRAESHTELGTEHRAECLTELGTEIRNLVDTDVLYSLAICYYEVGNESAAHHYAQRTVALESEHEGALALLDLFNEDE